MKQALKNSDLSTRVASRQTLELTPQQHSRLRKTPLALAMATALAFPALALAAPGDPLGGEFRVNTFTTSQQSSPTVARDADGDFVVTWQSNQDGSFGGIYAQRYNAAGVAQGGEFRVNTRPLS